MTPPVILSFRDRMTGRRFYHSPGIYGAKVETPSPYLKDYTIFLPLYFTTKNRFFRPVPKLLRLILHCKRFTLTLFFLRYRQNTKIRFLSFFFLPVIGIKTVFFFIHRNDLFFDPFDLNETAVVDQIQSGADFFLSALYLHTYRTVAFILHPAA